MYGATLNQLMYMNINSSRRFLQAPQAQGHQTQLSLSNDTLCVVVVVVVY